MKARLQREPPATPFISSMFINYAKKGSRNNKNCGRYLWTPPCPVSFLFRQREENWRAKGRRRYRSVCRQTFEPLTDLASRKADSFHGSSFLPVLRSFPEFVVILQKRRQDFDVCSFGIVLIRFCLLTFSANRWAL